MAPPTVMNKLEEELTALKASMAKEISLDVKKASMEMETTLTSQIATSMDVVATRLERRIDRSRETQEGLIASIRTQQAKFHTESQT